MKYNTIYNMIYSSIYAHPHKHYLYCDIYSIYGRHLEQTEGVEKAKGTVFSGRRMLFRNTVKSGSQGLAFELADAVEPFIQKK